MILSHGGVAPRIHESAWVAPTATVCGDVEVGPDCRVAHGATLVAEGGSISLGRSCIVLENAVVRGVEGHPVRVGDHCLVGPCAHLVGCTLEDEVFVATGAAVFHGAVLGRGSEVRVHATVHVRSELALGTTVPIGWVAVGRPAEVLSPDRHDRIWLIQEPLDFPLEAYGLDRPEADMPAITRVMSRRLGSHAGDREA